MSERVVHGIVLILFGFENVVFLFSLFPSQTSHIRRLRLYQYALGCAMIEAWYQFVAASYIRSEMPRVNNVPEQRALEWKEERRTQH